MRTYDFSPLWRSTIGFDRLLTSLRPPSGLARTTIPPTTSNGSAKTATRFRLQSPVFRPTKSR